MAEEQAAAAAAAAEEAEEAEGAMDGVQSQSGSTIADAAGAGAPPTTLNAEAAARFVKHALAPSMLAARVPS